MDEFKELYENLSPNKFSIENVTQLENKVELFEQEIKQLEAALNRSELDKRNLSVNYERDKKTLVSNHETLLANVSALFKTAKKEIERKNNTIKELNQKLDNLIFRREQKQGPPQNEIVQSQNEIVQSQKEDDAVCAKPVTEDRTVLSVIRPAIRNHGFSDRAKSSSGDRSPVPVGLDAKPYENVEKDKRIDSSRVKCVENTAPNYRLKDYNELKFPRSTSPEDSPDDYFDSKTSPDSYPHRRSGRKLRGADDHDRGFHRKPRKRHRYFPYEQREDDHERPRHKYRRREYDYSGEEYSRNRARKSPHETRKSPHDRDRHEFGDFRQEIACGSRTTNDDRRIDNLAQSANDDRQREAKPGARKSIENHRKEDRAYQKLVDDRRRPSPADLDAGRKPIEGPRRDNLAFAESGARKSIEDRRKEDPGHQKLIDDRRRRSPGNLEGSRKPNEGPQKDDIALAESGVRKSIEDRRKENPAYQKLIYDRRKQSPGNLEVHSRKPNEASISAKYTAIKSIEDRNKDDKGHQNSILNQHRESPANLDFNGKKPNEGHRRDDLAFAESIARKSVEDRKLIHDQKRESPGHLNFNGRKPNVDRPKENPAHFECVTRKSIDDHRREDLSHGDFDTQKLIENRREHPTTNLVFSSRKSNEERQRNDSTHSESNARKSIGDRSKEELGHLESVKDRKPESSANLESTSRKSVGHRKKDLEKPKLTVDQRQQSLANLELANLKSKEDRRREKVIQPEFNGAKSIEERRKNPAHIEITAKKPANDQKNHIHPVSAAKKLVSDEKRDSVAKLSSEKSIVDQKKGNILDAKLRSKKLSENRRSENAANSSQIMVDNQAPSVSHAEGGYPLDGQMKAVDILAQYGVYATPYKLLNGDKCNFAGFKLVSPIADTPDHLKALFNSSKMKVSPIPMINERRALKVSPIPMINERRALDGFNSPAKKSVPQVAKEDPATAANHKSVVETPKTTLVDDCLAEPSPSKVLLLNTVTTSPFKNCCIIKVKAEVVNNSAEAAAKEPATVSGTDSTNAEHGVFTRKRRAPVIRHIKKAES